MATHSTTISSRANCAGHPASLDDFKMVQKSLAVVLLDKDINMIHLQKESIELDFWNLNYIKIYSNSHV
jgi:hypothetical protein